VETDPSADTSTGSTFSSIPPPNTYTPAAFASSMTAWLSATTIGNSSSVSTMASLGKEMRYLVVSHDASEAQR
jgi:hypothetical protein